MKMETYDSGGTKIRIDRNEVETGLGFSETLEITNTIKILSQSIIETEKILERERDYTPNNL